MEQKNTKTQYACVVMAKYTQLGSIQVEHVTSED